ncbi:hypothetical protein JOM56_008177 [Amanita muscaria]
MYHIDPEPPWKMRHLITKSGRGIQSFIDIPNVSRLRVQGGIVDARVVNPVFFTTCNAACQPPSRAKSREAPCRGAVGGSTEREREGLTSQQKSREAKPAVPAAPAEAKETSARTLSVPAPVTQALFELFFDELQSIKPHKYLRKAAAWATAYGFHTDEPEPQAF